MNTAPRKTVHLCGREVESHTHVCAFFHSREEENKALVPFVKEGLEHGDRSFHIVDPSYKFERLRKMEEIGLHGATKEQDKRLEVRSWGEAYLRDKKFDQTAMLALIEEVLQQGQKENHPLTRLWANMEWALEDMPGVDDIIEYETRLNYVLPKYDDVVVCTYDLAKFSAGVAMDILRTHPMVILGGTLQKNPFFVPPDVLLEELKARRMR